ncbi:MAG: exo-alpha-sialidase [Chloroflexi bacterium]|nr:exo-alpha-sialidase [Chloroflexota bacterium]
MSKSLRALITIALSAITLLWIMSAVVSAAPTGLGSPIVIALTPGDSERPQIAYANAITHAVWAEAGWIMHSRHTGLAWTAPISVALGDDPSLVIDASGTPHLAFAALISGTVNAYHTRYAGNTWTVPLQVSDGLANTSAPDIAAAPDNSLTIVWSQNPGKQLRAARSINGGTTWPDLAPIVSANGSAPKIAIGADNVTHVVWQDDTASLFRIKHTQRLTGTWSLIDVLSDESANAFTPDVTADATQAHLVWQQSSSIRYARGANLNFTAPITLSTGTASAPAVASITTNTLAAAWDSGITITLRVNIGGIWSSPLTFGTNPSGAGQPALSAGPSGAIYGVFTWGSGTRDIAFNVYTSDITPNLPASPILLAPPSGTITTANAIDLMWQSGGGEVIGYNVDVDGTIITTSNTTSATLLPIGLHSWSVRAYNAGGYSAWASTWTVEVSNTLPAPGTPILVAPANGTITTSTSIQFAWQSGPGGTPGGYHIDVNGSIVTVTSPISTALLPYGLTTWTVRAFNASGPSAWAAARTLNVLQPRLFLPLISR